MDWYKHQWEMFERLYTCWDIKDMYNLQYYLDVTFLIKFVNNSNYIITLGPLSLRIIKSSSCQMVDP